jgi:hypothetical protein
MRGFKPYESGVKVFQNQCLHGIIFLLLIKAYKGIPLLAISAQ